MKTIIRLTIVTMLFSLGNNEVYSRMVDDSYPDGEPGSFKTCKELQNSPVKSAPDSSRSSVAQGGIGFGYMMKGAFFAINGKFTGSGGWGASLDFKVGASKTGNLPSDYNPIFDPMDYRSVVTLNLVRVLTANSQNPRFSFEVGPSLVSVDNAKISPNPDYDPESLFPIKYLKSRKTDKAIGVSISAETEAILAPFMIMDFSVFVNFNKVSSFMGIGLYINFGDVKD